MATLKSIVLTVNDGTQDHSFEVDLTQNCALFWGDSGWDLLAQAYQDVYKDKDKAKKTKDRSWPKAKGKGQSPLSGAMAAPLVALKDPTCTATQWP